MKVFTAILLMAGVLLSLSYSWITPIFESPDENAHAANICHVQQTRQMPDSAPVVYAARGHAVFEGHQMPLYYLLSAAVAQALGKDPCQSLPAPNDHPTSSENGRMFFVHPPLKSDLPFSDAFGNPVWLLRGVSIFFFAIAAIFTALSIRQVLPQSWIPVALGVGFVALNPQFTYISGTVSNDSAAAAIGAVLLYLMVRASTQNQWSTKSLAVMGVTLGLGVLFKASVILLVPATVMAVGILRSPYTLVRERLRGMVFVSLIFGTTCGWVFIRNAWLRGDPTLWNLQLEKLPNLIAGSLPEKPYWREVFLPVTFHSFWGVFGWMNLPVSDTVLTLCKQCSKFFLTMSFAFAGLSVLRRDQEKLRILLVLVIGVLCVAFGLVSYNFTFRQAQGRLLFPAFS